ncbi:protein FAM210A [Aphomia sociella]
MALAIRPFYRNCCFVYNITKPVKWNMSNNNFPLRIIASGICYQRNFIQSPLLEVKPTNSLVGTISVRTLQKESDVNKPQNETQTKPDLFQRFKEMYRDYWYVLVPVHMMTSVVWFGSCYYAVRSGVDVLAILESIGVSETLLAPIRDSSAGYFALAFALYKAATPLRYAVTVGGTTIAIKKLTAIGWIKPVPSKERIKELLQEKKDTLQDRFNESKQHYQTQMKEKSTQVMDEMRRYKTEMRNMKNKVKKM